MNDKKKNPLEGIFAKYVIAIEKALMAIYGGM